MYLDVDRQGSGIKSLIPLLHLTVAIVDIAMMMSYFVYISRNQATYVSTRHPDGERLMSAEKQVAS